MRMRQCIAYGLALASFMGLGGCGFFDVEEREPWRAEVEARCLASGAVQASAFITPAPRINGPGICGLDYPFRVSALADGTISLSQTATLSCTMIPALEAWLRDTVQPAAYWRFGMPVTEIHVAASYGCRPRNNKRGARMSEHAFANGFDVSGFTLADGRRISVLRGWNGAPDEAAFLRDAHAGSCAHFTTVLGPGSDRHHSDHLHVDLARHGRNGSIRVCQPAPVARENFPLAYAPAP